MAIVIVTLATNGLLSTRRRNRAPQRSTYQVYIKGNCSASVEREGETVQMALGEGKLKIEFGAFASTS